jgi:hypothetical protein
VAPLPRTKLFKSAPSVCCHDNQTRVLLSRHLGNDHCCLANLGQHLDPLPARLQLLSHAGQVLLRERELVGWVEGGKYVPSP